MRIARIATPSGPRHVIADGTDWKVIVDPFAAMDGGAPEYTGETFPIEGAELLAPVVPRVIVGIAHNPPEKNHPLPIQAWFKSVHTLAGPDADIVMVRDVGTVNIEGELTAVIGRSASNLTLENAFDHVLGFTIANDVTNVTRGRIDEKNFEGKGGENYTPIGPWIETEIDDPEDVAIRVSINGALVVDTGSFNLPSAVAATLVYVTRWITLEPGDIVLTGSPKSMWPVTPGDLVEIELPGIGVLRNPVV